MSELRGVFDPLLCLKPQDSFGRFAKNFARSSESGPYHQKAPLNPPAIVLNDML